MEGYLALYRCHEGCHVILVSWAEQIASEDARQSTFVITIIPKTQLGAIRNRVESVDRFHAMRAEFSPPTQWLELYARLLDQERACERQSRPWPCWAREIRQAIGERLLDVELRSVPLTSPVPHAL